MRLLAFRKRLIRTYQERMGKMNILSVRNLKKYYNTGENTVKALEEKQLICKQARYRNGSRARAANFYMIQDNPLLWKSSKAD